MLVYAKRGKPEYLEKNLLGQGLKPTTNFNPHVTPIPGFKPGPHWWEASVLITAPFLLLLSGRPCIMTE